MNIVPGRTEADGDLRKLGATLAILEQCPGLQN